MHLEPWRGKAGAALDNLKYRTSTAVGIRQLAPMEDFGVIWIWKGDSD